MLPDHAMRHARKGSENSRGRRLRCAAALAAAAVVIVAGGPPTAAEERRWPAIFQGRAEVSVVNVEVFVRDAEGRPVTGLTRDDFRLFENGEAVAISNFYAVEGGRRADPEGDESSAPTEDRDLRLAFFVDNENVTAANRKRALQRLREFVLANRRPELAMMVASLERSSAGRPLVIRQGFTAVAHDIFVALDELEHVAAGSHGLELERRDLARAIERLDVEAASDYTGSVRERPVDASTVRAEARAFLPRIQAYAEQRYGQARQALATLAQLVDALAPLPGRKALVYVSDGLPMKAGEGLFEIYARRVESLDDLAQEVSSQWQAARFDLTPEVLALVARANAARLTLYALDAAPPSSARRGAAETRAAYRSSALESFDELGVHGALTLMAEETGGRAALSPSALEATLAGVLTDFDHHYSLGYAAAPAVGEEGRRSIEVEIPGRDLEVRWRRGFRVKSSEERMAELVLATLVLGEPAAPENPLAVAVATAEIAPRDDGTFVVPLLVEVPVGKLVLTPERAAHAARVSLYVAARDAAGRVSEVTRHLCPIRVPNSELLVAYGRKMVCGVRLQMRGGAQGVAVAVRDEIADSVSVVRVDLTIPGL